jgi:hypothetical protein
MHPPQAFFQVFYSFTLLLWLHRKVDKLDLIDFYLLLSFWKKDVVQALDCAETS